MTVKRLAHCLEREAVMGNMEELREFVLDMAKDAGVTGEEEHFVFIALDELISNVIKYAYAGGQPGPVEVSCEVRVSDFHVEIRDSGTPFNPFVDAPVPDVEAKLEDRGIGGLGLHMIRKMIPSLNYRYDGGQNIVGFDVRI